MARPDIDIRVDMRDFEKDLKHYLDDQHPHAVALGFRSLSIFARDAVRQRTGEKYKLKSDYIPKGILSTPYTDNQTDAAAKSYAKHHDLIAAVFLRPSSQPSGGLAFMVPHETGENKTPAKGQAIAVPSYGVEHYSFRTSRGGVKTAFKPKTLLEGYQKHHLPASQLAAMMADPKPTKKGRKGKPFTGQTKAGVGIIGRRKGNGRLPIEVLYVFKSYVRSDGDWGFEPTIRAEVQAKYVRTIGRYINR